LFDQPGAAASPAPIEPPTIEPPASFAPPARFAIQVPPPVDPALVRAHETIAVLEQWLDAIHGSRAY
jgi:hypothetical protein